MAVQSEIFVSRDSGTHIPEYTGYCYLQKLGIIATWFGKSNCIQSLIIADCEQLDLSRTQGFQEKEVEEDGFSLLSLGIISLPKLGALPQRLLRGSANTLKNLTIADCEPHNFSRVAQSHIT